MWNVLLYYIQKLLQVPQQRVNGVYSMSLQVGRLEGFGEEAETGWRLP